MYQYNSKLLGVESVLVFMFSYIFHKKQIKKFKKDLLHIYIYMHFYITICFLKVTSKIWNGFINEIEQDVNFT